MHKKIISRIKNKAIVLFLCLTFFAISTFVPLILAKNINVILLLFLLVIYLATVTVSYFYAQDIKLLFSGVKSSFFQLPIAALILRDWKIVAVNNCLLDLFGYTGEEELLGKSVLEFVNQQYHNELIKYATNRVAGGEVPKYYEVAGRKKDGSLINLRISVESAVMFGDEVKYCSFQDIRYEIQMEQKLMKFSRAVEQSRNTIILTDTKGIIEYVNAKCCEISGYTKNELIGQNVNIMKSGEVAKENYKKLWDNLYSGEEWHGEFKNKTKRGDFYWEMAHISPIKDEEGEIINYLAIKEDITHEKQLDLDLIESAKKAEDSNRLKNSFLSNMNHELRTPMNGILGFASLLRECNSVSEANNWGGKIVASANRLMNTLNSLIEIADLESSGEFKSLIPVIINENIACLLNSYSQAANQKGVKFEIEIVDEIRILAREELLYQSIRNLVDNAVKFTDSGHVKVRVYSDYSNDISYGVIDVSDTGIGINQSDLNIIFEEFRQVSEGLARTFEGAGLGLTIVNKIILAMNGKIEVSSKIGEGSSFSIMLPLTAEESVDAYLDSVMENYEDKKEATILTNQKIKGLPLLLVEDNDFNQEVAKVYLQEDFKLDIVSHGNQAIEAASNKQYAAVFMDINLGFGIDGVETSARMKQIPGYENIPFIAITGYTSQEDREYFFNKGLQYYIAKPFKRNDIIRMLNDTLGNNGSKPGL